jgi:plasmid rolling circle replication initiator protein Rep
MNDFKKYIDDYDLNAQYENLVMSDDYLLAVRKHNEYNLLPLRHYKRFIKDLGLYRQRSSSDLDIKLITHFMDNHYKSEEYMSGAKQKTLANNIDSLANCNSLMAFDFYEKSKHLDFLKTNLCKDKFCSNCKMVKQASRMSRFMPEIEGVSKITNLYHLTLTVPNCSDVDLRPTIKKMFKAFPVLIEYFKNKKKIRDHDFTQYGYRGAIRSLEVTYKSNSYHPHLHCLIALDLPYQEKTNKHDSFSYNYGVFERSFSDLEILIQKIWFLLMNGFKVSRSNLSAEKGSYSCTLDLFEDGQYYELFKYMTKSNGSVSGADPDSFMSYRNFITLFFSLKNVRQIQGYGCFFGIKDEDLEELNDEKYNIFVSLLLSIELPKKVYRKPDDLLFQPDLTIISRKMNFQNLKQIIIED